ncbi:MAG: M23 family metallopeptidase [Clostridiales bacterium]|nr:M23 family metallopeptidase [Clostridiales bacterium]
MAKEFTNDRVVNEMARDGLQSHNLNTGEVTRISNRHENTFYGGSSQVSSEKGGGNHDHSYLQRRYNRKFQQHLKGQKQAGTDRERAEKKLHGKEAHMRKKIHLRTERVKKIDYAAYGKLGRPKDYVGEEHYKYGKRLQRTVKLYRTRDLATTRVVKGGTRKLFQRAEAMYFADDENNNAQRIMHDGYRAGKSGARYFSRKLSHPVNKLRNRSYLHTKKQYQKAGRKAAHHERMADKYRFRLSMETSWKKELRSNKAMQKLNARERLIKKILYKHAYKKKYGQTFMQKAKNNFAKAAKKTKQYIAQNTKAIITIGGVLLLVAVLFYLLASCATMAATFGTDGITQMMAGLYVTGFDVITECDEYFSKLLNDLQNDIAALEKDHPGYDEYQYWVNGVQVADAEALSAYIVYDQIELASYLSTKIPEYTLETAAPLMEELFGKMFIIEQEEIIEQRKRQAYLEDGTPETDSNGNAVMEWYDCHILKISLTSKAIAEIMETELTEDEYSQWDTFCRSEGNLKIYNSPFAFEWHPYISSYFGYRNHPIDGVGAMHKGIDIAVPEGTKIYSIMEGTVEVSGYSESAGNWIVIRDEDGYVSKYMHCSALLVGAGTQVARGQLIATVGSTGHSTGAHLHLQIEDPDGNYINPLYICAEYGEEISTENE